MAKGNVDLLHRCSPEHLRMGTARLKNDKETEEKGNQKKCETGKKYSEHENKDVPTA